MAFAAFQSRPENILLVSTSFPNVKGDDHYYWTIENAKAMAADGKIIVIDFFRSNREKEDPLTCKEFYRAYCFKAESYLQELMEFEPKIFNSGKRGHFKKSGSFINELLIEQIPAQSVENTVLKKSQKGKYIKSKL